MPQTAEIAADDRAQGLLRPVIRHELTGFLEQALAVQFLSGRAVPGNKRFQVIQRPGEPRRLSAFRRHQFDRLSRHLQQGRIYLGRRHPVLVEQRIGQPHREPFFAGPFDHLADERPRVALIS